MTGKNGHLPAATLDDIRAAKDLAGTVEVQVPEWGHTVTVRSLKRGEIKHAYSEAEKADNPDERCDQIFLQLGLVTPAVTEEEALELLREKAFSPMQAVLRGIMEASGITATFPA